MVRLLNFNGNDSHAEFGNLSNFDYTVACKSNITTIGNNCSGNYVNVSQLYSATDAHLSVDNYYPNNVCFNVTGPFSFFYNISATGATPSGYECVFSLARYNDSHIYECDNVGASINVNIKINSTIPPYSGCVDLENASTYQGKVYNWTEFGIWYGYWINDDVTLCQKTYRTGSVSMTPAAAVVINKSGIAVECNGSVFVSRVSGTIGFSISGKDDVTLMNCSITNYTKGFVFTNSNFSYFGNNRAYNNTDAGFEITNVSHSNFVDTWSYNNSYGFNVFEHVGTNYTRTRIINNSNTGARWWGWRSSNSTWKDGMVCSNKDWGLMVRTTNYTTFYNNTFCNTRGTGVALAIDSGSAYNNVTGNIFYGNVYGFGDAGGSSGCGIHCNTTIFNNTLTNNTYGLVVRGSYSNISGNRLFSNGIGLFLYGEGSSPNYAMGNEVANNSAAGIFADIMNNGETLLLSGNHYYNNSADLNITCGSFVSGSVTVTRDIFDNPQGNYQNYTTLSMYDGLSSQLSYSVNWTRNSAILPAGSVRFRDKFVSISVGQGSPSIENITWHWTDAESSGRDESTFALWKYNTTIGWLLQNNSPDTTNNQLKLTNLVPSSDYGILESAKNCPVITSPGTYSQPIDYTGAPNSAGGVHGIGPVCVGINANNVVFDCGGFGISDNATSGVRAGIFVNASLKNVTIRDCNVSGYNYSIYVADSNSTYLAYNSVFNSSTRSIVLSGCYNASIVNNTVRNSTLDGLFIESSGNSTFVNNTAYYSGWVGFRFDPASSYNRIMNNTAYNNSEDGFALVGGSSYNNLTGNVAYSNSWKGFRVDASDYNRLVNNTAYGNSEDGIAVTSSTGNYISGNKANSSGWGGFRVETATGQNTLTNNSASNNVNEGFFLDRSPNTSVYNNTAVFNGQGFRVFNSDNSSLADNTALWNYNNGFVVSGGADGVSLSANNASNNSQDGISVFSSNSLVISRNDISNNSNYGINLLTSTGSSVVNNTVRGNLVFGMYLSSLSGSVMSYNRIFESGSSGVYLVSNSRYNNVSNNTVYNNGAGGIVLQSGSGNNTLVNNTVYSHPSAGISLMTVSNVSLYNNTVRGCGIGVNVEGSFGNSANDTRLFNTTFFNNSLDLHLDNMDMYPLWFNMTSTYFLNPSGSYLNYTVLGISDRVDAFTEYGVNWTSTSLRPPSRVSFADKFVDISNLTAGVSIDRVLWTWLDSELSGYGENRFELWKYNASSGWTMLNSTPDTTNNALSLVALNPSSIYGIMQKPVWMNITFPEGVYEPYNASLVASNHLFTLNFTFRNFTGSAGDNLTCIVDMKTGSFKTINRTLSSGVSDSDFSLLYNMTSADADAIRRTSVGHIPWYVVNCSLYSNTGTLLYSSTSDYGSVLGKSIYVHNNSWTGFINGGDATAAALCWLGTKYIWFNNSRQCNFAGDRAYAIALSKGNKIEGYCSDGIDNDANTKWDCNSSNSGKGTDSFCKGLFYSCGSPEEGLTYDQVHPSLSVVPLLPYFNPFNPKVPPFMPLVWLALALLFTYASVNVRGISSFLPLRYASVVIPFMLFVCSAISGIVLLSASSAPVEAVFTLTPPANCDGNICNGTATIGSNDVTYSYTLHNRPGSKFKVRWNDDSVASANTMIFSANSLPNAISGNGTYNDSGSRINRSSYAVPYYAVNVIPPGTVVNYVTQDADGYTGVSDGVMWATFNSSVSTVTPYYFDLYAAHYGADMVVASSTPLYFDATAPTNDDESYTDTNMDLQYPCADRVDNDLDHRPDCLDINCNGMRGTMAANAAVCQYNGETNCSDRFDNDFNNDSYPWGYDLDENTGMDCRDYNCNNTQGDPTDSGKKCFWKNEYANYPTSCRDSFNNDADNGEGVLVDGIAAYTPHNVNYSDCLDADCWGKGGSVFTDNDTGHPCPSRENNSHSWCMDGWDNDYDDGNNTRDKYPTTGIDCRDYDCRLMNHSSGSYNNGTAFTTYTCPINEFSGTDLGTPSYAPDGGKCFDTLDNDIDNPLGKFDAPGQNIDCADADCNNVTNPANATIACTAYEFNLTMQIQRCNDAFDNDGDLWMGWFGGQDCTDHDCYQQFRVCGPCPSVENYTYDSCGDGIDNDYDNTADSFTDGMDCADINCTGEIGNLTGSQKCSGAGGETTDAYCSDSFDNDADGLADCKDPGCNGRTGPQGQTCQPAAETTCNDDADNDADGYIDCFDSDCNCGISVVAAGSHYTVPSYDYNPPGTLFPGTTTLRSYQLSHIYINQKHNMTFTGSSAYNDVFIYVGALSDPYMYNYTSCALTGPNASNFVNVKTGNYGYVTETLVGSFSNYNITLTCDSNTTPMAADTTNVLASTALYPTGSDEGNRDFTSQLHENTIPSVNALKIEPLDGASDANIRRGQYVAFIANATDPGAGLYTSGIWQCYFNVTGSYLPQNSGLCRHIYTTTSDVSNLVVGTYAIDGSDNPSPVYASAAFDINVQPIVSSPLTINKTKPFVNSSELLHLDVSFITADNGNFAGAGSRCNVTMVNASGNIVGYYELTKSAASNMVDCNGTVSGPAANGMYTVYVNATDEDGDMVKSNAKVFYVCNNLVASGAGWACSKADFDQDGATEGLNTTLYGASLACDNCVNRYNPDQYDFNANGIGDSCEFGQNGSITIVGPNGTEITPTRNVFLNLTYDSSCLGSCRWANDNATNLTVMPWQPCTTVKAWLLSEGEGNKTVWYEIKDCMGRTGTSSDTILYRFTQDFTPPTPPTVYDGLEGDDIDWWNSNATLSAHWFNSSEDISNIIYYRYLIRENSSCYNNDCNFTSLGSNTSVTVTNLVLKESWVYSFDVQAYNPFNISSEAASSDGTRIDLTAPDAPVVNSTSHPDQSRSYPANEVSLNWTASDIMGSGNMSGIRGYSFMLDSYPGTAPDSILDDRSQDTLSAMPARDAFQLIRANSSVASPHTYAVFAQLHANITQNDSITVRVALAELGSGYADLMQVKVYLISVANGAAISLFNQEANAISGIANISQDIKYASVPSLAEIYQFSLTANTTVADTANDIYVVVSGVTTDNDNTKNLSIAAGTSSVDASSWAFVCNNSNSCTNVSASVEYAIEVTRSGTGSMWTAGYSLGDGTYYFHVKADDVAGNWGNVSHFRINVAGGGVSVGIVSPVDGTLFTTDGISQNISVKVMVSGNASVYVVAKHPDGSIHSSANQTFATTGIFGNITLELGTNEIFAVANTSSGAITTSSKVYVLLERALAPISNRTLKVYYGACSASGNSQICSSSEATRRVGAASEVAGSAPGLFVFADTSQNSIKIFNSKSFDANSLDDYFADNEFMDLEVPSFSFGRKAEGYVVQGELRYPDIFLGGDLVLAAGKYEIYINHNGVTSDGKVNLSISIR